MRRQMLSLLAVCMILCTLFSSHVQAASITPSVRGSITLYYTMDGCGFEDLEICAYRVAEVKEDGSFELIAPFSEYPVSVEDMLSPTEWQKTASTLAAYVTADNLHVDVIVGTDETGMVIMDNMMTGLYLIRGVLAEKDDVTYFFNDFFISIPSKLSNGTYTYHVEAKPKRTLYVPPTEYKVVKLWKDEEHTDRRPKQIEVEILKDGVLQETQLLKEENDWSYTWQVPEGEGKWTVVEKNTKACYRVEITEKENIFRITNVYEPEIPDTPGSNPPPGQTSSPPRTGDTAPIMLYIILLCVSGLALLIVGVYMSRKKSCEKE